MLETRKHTALIVVDAQYGFIDDYTQRIIPEVDNILSQDFAMKIATQFVNPPVSPFRTFLGWHAMDTPEEIRLLESVEQHCDTIVTKNTYGCGKELLNLLQDNNITTAVLVGIDTDACVLRNAVSLFDNGIEVFIYLPACATGGGAEIEKAAESILRRTLGEDHIVHSLD